MWINFCIIFENLSDKQNKHVSFKHGNAAAYTVNNSTVTLHGKGNQVTSCPLWCAHSPNLIPCDVLSVGKFDTHRQ
jgi:hypothetical protein